MRVTHLWLTNFRCYQTLDLALSDGLTVVEGTNGQGKTSLLEALTWAATTKSFRGVPDAALVQEGNSAAILRAAVTEQSGREQLLEAEIQAVGRNRIRVNGKHVARNRDLAGFLRVTVFAPDDLDLIKGSPGRRRDFLDDLLLAMAPKYAAVCGEYDRVVRQRNTLLKQPREPDATTLAVFDDQLVLHGAALLRGRLRLAERLAPHLGIAYHHLAGPTAKITETYAASWTEHPLEASSDFEGELREALGRHRQAERDRRTTLVGPHRDDWTLLLDGREARTHASQGEQRSLALALRLGGHALVKEVIDDTPVLLLDDVFSELDPQRAEALVANLPTGQTLITTAGPVPLEPDVRLHVDQGRIIP